ncbi:MAG TPA: flagellar basal body L-ring protein FlgH [Phycisphaerae bacterium]|jgi:flagellar L-ring protein precursor FlgH
MKRSLSSAFVFAILGVASSALAQSSSIARVSTTPTGSMGSMATAPTEPNAPAPIQTKGHAQSLPPPGGPAYTALLRTSLIALTMPAPKKFKTHDLITIIVREQHKFESDGDSQIKNKFDAKSELDAFIKFTGGGVGAADFRRGKPNIDYSLNTDNKDEARQKREDTLTTRITAEIIDIKPNGNLVLSAQKTITYDEETSALTLTGTCRSGDVTPDNTILSTQVADMALAVENHGAVKDGTKRGWFTKLFGTVKPF